MGTRMSATSIRFLTAAVTVAGVGVALTASPVQARTAEVVGADYPNAIPGEYIVAFEDATESAAARTSQVRSIWRKFGSATITMMPSTATTIISSVRVKPVERVFGAVLISMRPTSS